MTTEKMGFLGDGRIDRVAPVANYRDKSVLLCRRVMILFVAGFKLV